MKGRDLDLVLMGGCLALMIVSAFISGYSYFNGDLYWGKMFFADTLINGFGAMYFQNKAEKGGENAT